MKTKMVKMDRTARLLRIQLLLGQYSKGLDVKTIARLCAVNARTVYRDLKALETELNVPIWQESKKRGIVEGYFLPPITFNLTEAITIFSCARLIYNHLRVCNPGIISTFMQLSSIMPPPLREQIQKTIDNIEKLPRNEKGVSNFNKLVNAWLSQHPVYLRCLINPKLVPATSTERSTWKQRFSAIPSAWGIVLVVLVIIGGIFSGVFTPTEAGAVGAFVTLIAALALRKSSPRDIFLSIKDSAGVTGMILFILVGGLLFGNLIALSQLPETLSNG